MNSCGKQYGRTRVNKVADSKIYNKRVTKKKQSKLTSFDKLCLLQISFTLLTLNGFPSA